MGTFWKTYRQTILLLFGILVGACVGLVFGERATVLTPFGDVFLNLLLVIIVPLIFLTISTSIAKIHQPKRLGKVLGVIVLTFVIMSLVAVFIGFLSTYFITLVEPGDSEAILDSMEDEDEKRIELFNTFRELLKSAGTKQKNDVINLVKEWQYTTKDLETKASVEELQELIRILQENNFVS